MTTSKLYDIVKNQQKPHLFKFKKRMFLRDYYSIIPSGRSLTFLKIPVKVAIFCILFSALFVARVFAANARPSVGTVSPNSGTSTSDQAVTFTTTYSDRDGWQNIQDAVFLINTSTSGAGCFYGYYNQNTHLLYLRNDSDTAWLGGYAPGSDNIIENSFAKLDCSQTVVSGSGTTISVSWNITPKPTFLGTKYMYLLVRDDNGAVSNWSKKGSWRINALPQVGTVNPASGTSSPNQTITFTTTYSDANGWQDIQQAHFLINASSSGENCFLAYYNQNTNRLYLRNDADTAWLGGFSPGAKKVIENSFVQLICSKTAMSGSGETLTITWTITFKSTFAGDKNIYLYVKDDYEAYDGWIQKGTWTIIQVLSIAVNPKLWLAGLTEVNKTTTMTAADKITVTNDGSGPETFELKLVNPSGWTAATVPGEESYVLSGIFCNSSDAPAAAHFNQDALSEDVITTESIRATDTVFGYAQSTANGVAVPASGARSLYLQLKSPTITEKKEEQDISVIVSCQIS